MKTMTTKETKAYIESMNPPMDSYWTMVNWLLENDPKLEMEYHMRIDCSKAAYKSLTKGHR